jgi:hypothetical protein
LIGATAGQKQQDRASRRAAFTSRFGDLVLTEAEVNPAAAHTAIATKYNH